MKQERNIKHPKKSKIGSRKKAKKEGGKGGGKEGRKRASQKEGTC